MSSSQTRAIQNYRARLSERGLARFEVLGRDADRELIRLLARRLAENSPESARIRAAVSDTINGEPAKKGEFSQRFAARLWLGLTLSSPVTTKKVVRSSSDALSSRYEYPE